MVSAAKSIPKNLLTTETPSSPRVYSIILTKIKKGLLLQNNYKHYAKTAITYQIFSLASSVNEMSGVIALGPVIKGIPRGKIMGRRLHCLPHFHRAICRAA